LRHIAIIERRFVPKLKDPLYFLRSNKLSFKLYLLNVDLFKQSAREYSDKASVLSGKIIFIRRRRLVFSLFFF
jgi:hypothetical protein